jgi:hypothetical protein
MSESAAKLLLVQILLTNEAARRQFHEVSVSSSAARPLPDAILPYVGTPDENEFEQEIEAINQLIYGDDSDEEDEPWNPMSACDLEEEVEAAFDAIETACAEEEWSDVGMVPRVVAFSTKLDGLKALLEMADAMLEGKKKPATASLMNYEVGKVARMMKEIATSLKRHEKDQVLQTPFDTSLRDLTRRIAPWKEEFAEVGKVLRSR